MPYAPTKGGQESQRGRGSGCARCPASVCWIRVAHALREATPPLYGVTRLELREYRARTDRASSGMVSAADPQLSDGSIGSTRCERRRRMLPASSSWTDTAMEAIGLRSTAGGAGPRAGGRARRSHTRGAPGRRVGRGLSRARLRSARAPSPPHADHARSRERRRRRTRRPRRTSTRPRRTDPPGLPGRRPPRARVGSRRRSARR